MAEVHTLAEVAEQASKRGEDDLANTALSYARGVARRRIATIPMPIGHAAAQGGALKRARRRTEGGEFRRVWG